MTGVFVRRKPPLHDQPVRGQPRAADQPAYRLPVSISLAKIEAARGAALARGAGQLQVLITVGILVAGDLTVGRVAAQFLAGRPSRRHV